ncbi:MAG: alanine--tRNA ligase, partial [Candidatus Marinimicrobia bacterium]|nr:alanine--tRNA ligase [Candidatus Neomarinimicrobiota bacterium]
MKSANQIRDEFFSFFTEKDHTLVPSDSLRPGNEPPLFTNAGMNQFKDVFLDTGSRDYNRAVDTQKCLRVSGKHNDLDEVGYDTYHHTFFEMLGNWSFGDYFKKEAVAWAWELLTEVWGIDPDRLYATVHMGDKKLELDADDEAAQYWKSETTINPEHVLFFDSKDNFWMMGDTGPCGPCSEVHIDLRSDVERAEVPGETLVNADDPRVMEIWNLVFIQYNALENGSLEPLAAKHVDTGMGFERVVAILQEKTSNYDTDLFLPLLDRVAELSPHSDLKSYDSPGGSEEEAEKRRVAMRVIADHARTVAFAIADGVLPGNVGRGYVIRRILRRAVRFGYQTLDLKEPFLSSMVDVVRASMSGQFPELDKNPDYVDRIVRAEEDSFLETLGTGLQYFERIVPYIERLSSSKKKKSALEDLRKDKATLDLLKKAYVDLTDRDLIIETFTGAAKRGTVSGEIGFLLHDTYGFPVDLTQLMAREEFITVDMDRYKVLMEEQKSRARASASFSMATDESNEWQSISDTM